MEDQTTPEVNETETVINMTEAQWQEARHNGALDMKSFMLKMLARYIGKRQVVKNQFMADGIQEIVTNWDYLFPGKPLTIDNDFRKEVLQHVAETINAEYFEKAAAQTEAKAEATVKSKSIEDDILSEIENI